MANIFAFRSGRAIKNVNPQEVGEELERIRSEKGAITPVGVIEEARSETSPMHAAFEWDDSEAAEQYRLTQARRLITSVRILNGQIQKPVAAFVSVTTPNVGRNYVPTIEAMTDEAIRLRVLSDARQFIESLERRYSHLAEIGDLIERMKKSVG